jgi:hypothetical protein
MSVRKDFMQRNTKVIAEAGLIPRPRELRAVCRGTVFLDNIKGASFNGAYRVFHARLDSDGSISVCGTHGPMDFRRTHWQP